MVKPFVKCYSCKNQANRFVRWVGHDGTTMDIPQCSDHGSYESVLYFLDPLEDIDFRLSRLNAEKEKIEKQILKLWKERKDLLDDTPIYDGDSDVLL